MSSVGAPSHVSHAAYAVRSQAWLTLSPAVIAAALIVCDLTVIIASLASAHFLYMRLFLNSGTVLDALSMAGLAAVITVSIIALRDGYNFTKLADRRFQIFITLQAWFFGFFVIGWVAFLSKTTDDFSRIGVTTGFIFGLAILLTARVTLIQVLTRLAAQGALKLRSAYAIFAVSEAERQRRLEQLEHEGTTLVGIASFALDDGKNPSVSDEVQTIINDVKATLSTEACEAVYLFLPWSQPNLISEFKRSLMQLPLPIYLFANDEYDQIVSGRGMRVSAMPAFEIQRAPLSIFERAMKRAMDVSVSLCLLFILSPMLFLTSLAIMFESGRPILYRQKRKGFGGRRFEILKFRTMYVCEDEKSFTQAKKGDSRITPLGNVLRRMSIDELPQLWNILWGDMSLVGPRPHPVALDNQYDALIAKYAERHHMKPGLTGWAQINGCRGETPTVASMNARVQHDLWYVDNWSIWLDIKILLSTAFIAPFDSNAR
jgi:Undecaprenyl-phosphate glucose phosphotransferase